MILKCPLLKQKNRFEIHVDQNNTGNVFFCIFEIMEYWSLTSIEIQDIPLLKVGEADARILKPQRNIILVKTWKCCENLVVFDILAKIWLYWTY